jgi:tetratricopeptide (TPR) repeat protein
LQAKGEFAQVSENMETARSKPGQPVKRGTMAHEHELYLLLADAAAERRDLAALREHAPRLEELALCDDHRLYLGIAQRAWAVTHWLSGEYEPAQARLERALELFRQLDTRWQAGRTHRLAGEIHVESSNLEEARRQFGLALEAFEAMKAIPDLERTRAALRALE